MCVKISFFKTINVKNTVNLVDPIWELTSVWLLRKQDKSKLKMKDVC
jgi:hypothetical protein